MGRVVPTVVAALSLTLLGAGVATSPAQAVDSGSPAGSSGVYLVVLRDAPVASYRGGIGAFAATAPAAGERFDDSTATAVAYRSHLLAQQDSILDRLGSPPELYAYTTALNGFAATLTADQVKTLETDPEVLLVQRDSRVTVDGTTTQSSASSRQSTGRAASSSAASQDAAVAERLWGQVGGPQRAGRGVVVGVIDTGVWPENPSLAGIPITAGARALAYPGFSGICQTGARWTPSTCNSKVIAARYFVRGFGRLNVASSDYLSARDGSGHGTSVAAIAAGNAGVDTRIGAQEFGHISGQAPAAALSVYKACWTAPDPSRDGCDTADTVKAIDQAVEDGVDVINYSIGDPAGSLADPVQLAFLNAAAANVFVATAAGNGGPAPGTVQHPAPWVTTVGANTQQVFQGGVRLGDGHTYIGAMLSDRAVGPSRLVYAGDVAAHTASSPRAALCYPGSLDAQQVDGAIVVCDRGVTSRVSKSAAVAQAGGRAMVLVNTAPGTVDADLHRVPTVHLDVTAGAHVKAYLARAGAAAVASIVPGATDHPPVPTVADFSGRGPSSSDGGDVLKPDLTAPGVSVTSAVAPTAGADQLWDVLSGTSIAAPHVAGLAAVIRGAHPSWTPAATKSAMMTSAAPLEGPSTALTRGAGELDSPSSLRPGLVYDSGIAAWSSLLRADGIDITGLDTGSDSLGASDVNSASIAVGDLVGQQSVTRTVTNVASTTETYTAAVTGLRGIARTVTPATLTLGPGRSATFTVTVSATKNARYNAYATGDLTWTGRAGESVVSPVVVRPQLAATPAEETGAGRSGTATINARAGVTGTLHVVSTGLVAATPVPLSLHAGIFDTAQPGTSAATALESLSVPPGSRAARFQVSDPHPGDDVDLFVYRDGALVSSATTASADETVTLSRPRAGTYQVYVTAHRADATTADVTFTSWVLPHATTGNLQLTRHYLGVDGNETFTVGLAWTGLDPARRWWGYVAYRGLPGVTYVTVN